MGIPPPRAGSAALITGASSGIGAAIATELCRRGHDAVLVARRRDRLDILAGELRERFGRRIEVAPTDLADTDSRQALLTWLADVDLDIDVAVLSAGFGMGGAFVEHEPDQVVQMVRTNVESTMVLAHAVLRPMVDRRRGALLIVSSMAGNQPMPYFGAYAATKAAVTSFAEMLSGEVGEHGVTVTAPCPGGVRTEFSTVGGLEEVDGQMPEALKINADECAVAGLHGLETGRRVIVPRAAVRALAFAREPPAPCRVAAAVQEDDVRLMLVSSAWCGRP
jgi:uncharacterized protein